MRKSLSKKKQKESLLKDRALLVKTALESGHSTRLAICKATGLTMVQLKNLFQEDREIYAEYVVYRKTIADIAADNIVTIINDPQHPQHFQASKYVLQNFKSDLDEVLESGDSILKIEQPSGGGKSKVKIVFSNTNTKEEGK